MRFVVARLRGEWRRMVVTGTSIVVAVSSFAVLTSSAADSRLQTTATVNANFRSAYDILVRPRGSQTAVERATGKVRPNYLSGIYGGITEEQLRLVRQVSSVEVAAPIAMVGQVLQTVDVPVDVTGLVGSQGRSLLRFGSTVSYARGLGSVKGPAGYVYVGNRLTYSPDDDFPTTSTLADGRTVKVCSDPGSAPLATSAFDPILTWSTWCWDRSSGESGERWPDGQGRINAYVRVAFPVLIAGIDPQAEARLDGVDKAVSSGRYLSGQDGPTLKDNRQTIAVPVLSSSVALTNQSTTVQVQRLDAAATDRLERSGDADRARSVVLAASGRVVKRATITSQQALDQWRQVEGTVNPYLLFQPGSVSYDVVGDRLRPRTTQLPAETWSTPNSPSMPFAQVSPTAADTTYRSITSVPLYSSGSDPGLGIQLRSVGSFDPKKVHSGPVLSQVPLETYQPPSATAANAATRAALKGQPLLPDNNPAGYLQAPPVLLTTLAGAKAFTNPRVFDFPAASVLAKAPISVIRVRLAGVSGVDPLSRERIRLAAEQIQRSTGLDVDITAGSSPAPTVVDLPRSRLGVPALQISENWVKKGVAATIVTAIDRKSLALFLLILLSTALAVAISTSAAVRARRAELGMLACVGWRRSTLYRSVLAETAIVAAAAGVIGAVLALPLSHLVGTPISLPRAALAVPAAVLLGLAAAFVPAWRAARAEPLAAVRPPVTAARHAITLRGPISLGLGSLARTPARLTAGAISLAAGVSALTILIGIVLGFRGDVVGSLLGNAISVQVHTADLVAGALITVISFGTLLDISYLDVREQGPRYAALSAMGWRRSALTTLVLTQSTTTAVIGATTGAALGLLTLSWLAPLTTTIVWTTILIATVAVVIAAMLAWLLPAQSALRLPTARLLTQD